ncbi:MAG: hypothetical protein KKB02_09420 [Alphaproteobacteria bacterium]|nr:hypothetical protein [Alphaproteobacteria bacterium]
MTVNGPASQVWRGVAASACLCLAMLPAPSAAESPIATGAIEISSDAGSIEISALVTGHSPQAVLIEATLEIHRADESGDVRTVQSKTVEVVDGQTLSVSTSALSLTAQGTLDIDLSLRNEMKIVHHVHHMVRQDASE